MSATEIHNRMIEEVNRIEARRESVKGREDYDYPYAYGSLRGVMLNLAREVARLDPANMLSDLQYGEVIPVNAMGERA